MTERATQLRKTLEATVAERDALLIEVASLREQIADQAPAKPDTSDRLRSSEAEVARLGGELQRLQSEASEDDRDQTIDRLRAELAQKPEAPDTSQFEAEVDAAKARMDAKIADAVALKDDAIAALLAERTALEAVKAEGKALKADLAAARRKLTALDKRAQKAEDESAERVSGLLEQVRTLEDALINAESVISDAADRLRDEQIKTRDAGKLIEALREELR